MRWVLTAGLCGLVSTLSVVAWAQDAGTPDVEEAPQLEATAPGEVTIGDAFEVSVSLTIGAQELAAVPEQSVGSFAIVDRKSITAAVTPETVQHTFTLSLLALEPGSQELPSLRIRVTDAAGNVTQRHTKPAAIRVTSLIANEPNAEFKPETAPVQVEQDDYTLAWVLGVLAAMALGALLAMLVSRWWRRREVSVAPPPPPRPPWEIALEELERLREARAPMIAEGQTDAWVDGVSDVIRAYLGRRFGFDGLERTTDEMVSTLRARRLEGIAPDEAAQFLQTCDLVKFARAPMALEASKDLESEALRLVRATRPVSPAAGGSP